MLILKKLSYIYVVLFLDNFDIYIHIISLSMDFHTKIWIAG